MSIQSYEKFIDKNRFYTDKELKELFDENFKNNFGPSLVLKNFEDYKKYSPNSLSEDEIITIKVDGEEKEVSKYLIKDLIEDEGMYRYLLLNMDNELGIAAKIIFVADDRYYCIKLHRAELASCLENISSDYKDNSSLNIKVNMRIGLIRSLVTEKSLIAKSYGNTKLFQIGVDGKKVLLPEEYIVKLLVMGNKRDFLNELDKDKYGYSKEVICYAIVQFVERNRILYKYSLSKKTLNFYNRLKNYEIIDFESLNKNRISNAYSGSEEDISILDTVSIPESMIYLISHFPHKNYSPLEIALYLYVELSYFYSKYIEESNIKDSESTNNFILIYAKILDSLGISYTINQNVIANVELNNNKLTFSSGEFMCSIDSSKEINLEDIMYNKINDEYLNMTSINTALVSKIKFRELTKRIYTDYINDKKHIVEFEDNLNKYRYQFGVSMLDRTTRIRLFIKAVARKDLKGIGNVEYINNVFNNVLGKELGANLYFLIAAKNNKIGLQPLTILMLENLTILIDPSGDETVRVISESDMIDLFHQGYYLYSSDIALELKKGDKYVRHN